LLQPCHWKKVLPALCFGIERTNRRRKRNESLNHRYGVRWLGLRCLPGRQRA
jgi:hypothetical protein